MFINFQEGVGSEVDLFFVALFPISTLFQKYSGLYNPPGSTHREGVPFPSESWLGFLKGAYSDPHLNLSGTMLMCASIMIDILEKII